MKYLVIFLVLLLAACTTPASKTSEDTTNPLTGLSVQNTDQINRNTDWRKQEIYKLEFEQDKFHQSYLEIKKSLPSKLEIANLGESTACFESSGFFEAIAPYKVTSPQGEVQFNDLKQIKVQAKQSLTFWFVPLKRGQYPLSCEDKKFETKLIIK